MRIALDVMGGDFAPEACISGAVTASERFGGSIKICLIGNSARIEKILTDKKINSEKFEIIHASEVISMHDSPTKAIQEKTNSSIYIGFHLLKEKKIDAFISSGHTGAMLVGSVFVLGTLKGVLRPTIGTLYPSEGRFIYLLDVGLNADCKPEHLVQFAHLGNIFAKFIMKRENPRIGLLNVGEEKSKGNILVKETYGLLEKESGLNFIGNVEGRDLLPGKADVIICEGFVGNVILKLSESIYSLLTRTKADADLLERFNFEWYGGTPVLGVNGVVIVGHGISGPRAYENMIKNAKEMIEAGMTDKIRELFQTGD